VEIVHCSKSEVSKTRDAKPAAYKVLPSGEYQTLLTGPVEKPAKPLSSDKFPALRQSIVTGCAAASDAVSAAAKAQFDTDLYPNDTLNYPIALTSIILIGKTAPRMQAMTLTAIGPPIAAPF
jgi:hypothetical protein